MSKVENLEHIFLISQIGCKVQDLEETPLVLQLQLLVPVFHPSQPPVPLATFSAVQPLVPVVSFSTAHIFLPAKINLNPSSTTSSITTVHIKEDPEDLTEDIIQDHLASTYSSELRAHSIQPEEVIEEGQMTDRQGNSVSLEDIKRCLIKCE